MNLANLAATSVLLLAFVLPVCAAQAGEAPAESVQPPPASRTPPVALTSHAVTAADYPAASIAFGEEGRVEVKYLVREDGSVGDTVVEKSSGSARLDDAAAVLVKRWRFKPATENGRPIPMWVRVSVVWKLYGDSNFDAVAGAPGSPLVMVDAKPEDYPPESRAARESGMTILMIVVDERGAVGTVVVMRTSGHGRLDQAAIKLAMNGRVRPATMAGKPVKTMLMLAVRWAAPH